MMSSQVAENYQLKWHSHLTNLNSSVATLYRNEKFADVLLFTSNSDSASGIPAHKIILSSCSHYFASIFEVNPSPPNAMVYIVLPPELSKRSIQTLIQYMYSGEATVSNDILNEVLRGGEVLKIRGLWRNNQTSEPNASSTPQFQASGNPPLSQQSTLKMGDGMPSFTSAAVAAPPPPPPPLPPPPLMSAKENPVITDTNKSMYEQQRPADRPGTTAVIKESPVIVMSPRQSMPPALQPQSVPVAASSAHGVMVKMEMAANDGANDPSIPAVHYGLVSLQIAAAAVKKAQQTSEKRCKSGLPALSIKTTAGHHQNGSDPLRRYSDELLPPPLRCDLADAAAAHHHHRALRDSDILRMTDDKQRMSIVEQSQRSTAVHHHLEPGEKSRSSSGRLVMDKKQQQPLMSGVGAEANIPEALSFLTIKQEPLEWAEYEHENGGGIDKSQIEVTVKPELAYADDVDTDDEDVDENNEMVYSPLTCELCSETFTIPAEWVRHIEGHAEATQCVPKKRKRIDIESATSENIAALRCDLCSMFFVTPAEWVRHVQNTHTETELALSNNSSPPKRNHRPSRPLDGQPVEKACSICKKSFPSYASMVIHKRTHTGERPFYCSLCNKGFNVKSNLLRHMRTLHNQLLNPSNLSDFTPDGIIPDE